HRRDDPRDAAHLVRQVLGHEVDAVGQVLPGAGDALHHRLPTQLTFRPYLPRYPRNVRASRRELVHHRVDRILQVQDLTPDVNRNLLREVAARDCGRDGGDVADLARQVAPHQIHAVSQVLPGACNPLDLGLPAQLTFGPDLPRYP